MPRVFKVQDILDGFEGLALRTIVIRGDWL